MRVYEDATHSSGVRSANPTRPDPTRPVNGYARHQVLCRCDVMSLADKNGKPVKSKFKGTAGRKVTRRVPSIHPYPIPWGRPSSPLLSYPPPPPPPPKNKKLSTQRYDSPRWYFRKNQIQTREGEGGIPVHACTQILRKAPLNNSIACDGAAAVAGLYLVKGAAVAPKANRGVPREGRDEREVGVP